MPRGVPAWEVVLLGGCTCPGGVPARGTYLSGGAYLPRGVPAQGGCLPMGGGLCHVTYPIMHLMSPVCCLHTN